MPFFTRLLSAIAAIPCEHCQTMTDNILLVDDEPNVLDSLQRQLRKRFTVVTATSGKIALQMPKERVI